MIGSSQSGEKPLQPELLYFGQNWRFWIACIAGPAVGKHLDFAQQYQKHGPAPEKSSIASPDTVHGKKGSGNRSRESTGASMDAGSMEAGSMSAGWMGAVSSTVDSLRIRAGPKSIPGLLTRSLERLLQPGPRYPPGRFPIQHPQKSRSTIKTEHNFSKSGSWL